MDSTEATISPQNYQDKLGDKLLTQNKVLQHLSEEQEFLGCVHLLIKEAEVIPRYRLFTDIMGT